MAKLLFKTFTILLLSLIISACNTQKHVEMDLSITASLDGKPAPGAQVMVDGALSGSTDQKGAFLTRLVRLPGQEVSIVVEHDTPGYKIEKWEQTFVTKLAADNAIIRYPFEAKLISKKHITLAIAYDNEPLEGAAILIMGQKAGLTDADGRYTYTYTTPPENGFAIGISKNGYKPLKKTVQAKPGDHVGLALKKKPKKSSPSVAAAPRKKASRQVAAKSAASRPTAAKVKKKTSTTSKSAKASLTISARSESYGVSKALPNVLVSINGKQKGKTDGSGNFVYRSKSASGKKLNISLSAPGHVPAKWDTQVTFKGKQSIERNFYPATPPTINVGMYGFINNSPEEDLAETLVRVEEAVQANLFIYRSFKEVEKTRLHNQMLMNQLDMETISTKGWQHTPMVKTVDMILSGSVTKNEKGLTIETTLTTADGKTLLSQINTARKTTDIRRTSKIITASIIDQFPFEGTISAVEADGYAINLGQHNYKIRRGNIFRYLKARMDKKGRITGYNEKGLLRVIKTEDTASLVEIAKVDENTDIKVGDKVIRRVYLEEEREAAKASFVLLASGGIAGNAKPLWGVNVYLNNTWVGTTKANGKVQVPVHLYEAYDLLLSRHGFQPVQTRVSIEKDKTLKSISLETASALLKIDSEPSQADVFVDGVLVGKTPLMDGKLVNFGFRKIRLSAKGEYRDWEKVVEFNKPEIAFVGTQKITFLKDHYKIGQMAEQNNNIDGAIAAYAAIKRENPDYSNARHRLAQLYMDEKNDFPSAIKAFENVLALPENRQIIYKQFAITYTNLGHAYYENGNQLIWKDKKAAAQNFAKAIEKLKIAKQNTRFFPTSDYSQAVHDTYYYLAIASHKLYLLTHKSTILAQADQAWSEYFDFFPRQLEGNGNFEKIRKAARQYWSQIQELS